MTSLRAEIAELKKRMLALEARQLMWRHDAAAGGNPGAPDCWQAAPAFALTGSMRRALDDLWNGSVARGQLYVQVDIHPCEDDSTVMATAYFRDGADLSISFDRPENFDANACRQAFGAYLNVE